MQSPANLPEKSLQVGCKTNTIFLKILVGVDREMIETFRVRWLRPYNEPQLMDYKVTQNNMEIGVNTPWSIGLFSLPQQHRHHHNKNGV